MTMPPSAMRKGGRRPPSSRRLAKVAEGLLRVQPAAAPPLAPTAVTAEDYARAEAQLAQVPAAA